MRNLRTEKKIMAQWQGDLSQTLVSICCITYNHEPYIEDALEGFLIQETDFPFEILIHDDASTDRTAQIVREYAAKYPKLVKPVYQTTNQYSQGIKVNYEFNYPRVKSKYIAICEGDDYWIDSKKLQIQVNFLENNPEYGLVHTDDSNYYQETGKIIHSHKKNYYPTPPNGMIYEKLLEKNFISTLTVVTKADLLKRTAQKLGMIMDHKLIFDYSLWLEISQHTKIMYLDIVTAMYRISKGTASRGLTIKDKQLWEIKIISIKLFFLNYYTMSDVKKSKMINDIISDILRRQFQKEIYMIPLNLDYKNFIPSNLKEKILFFLFKKNAPRFFFLMIELPYKVKKKCTKIFYNYPD